MTGNAQAIVNSDGATNETSRPTVFSDQRTVQAPLFDYPPDLIPNKRLKMDGLEFLACLPEATIPVAFLDPQYRGLLEKMKYGNEGEQRGRRRALLKQMSEATIGEFIRGIDRALLPSGHLFLWIDKFHLCQGFRDWLTGTRLDVVDLVTWDKETLGMGYRTRRRAEYCIILQKEPRRAKGVWKVHTIADIFPGKADRKAHPHAKPVQLQGDLIEAVSNEGDIVIDPAAGSFSVLQAAKSRHRNFLGCDLEG